MFQQSKFQAVNSLVVLSIFGLVTATNLVAEGQHLAAIKPYLNRDTAFVGWLDIDEIDLPGLQKFALKYDVQLGSMEDPIGFQKAFPAVGISHLFVVATLTDMMTDGPVFILPCRSGAARAARLVVATRLPNDGVTVEVDGDNLLVGAPSVVKRYQADRTSDPTASLLAEINGIKLPNAAIIQVPSTATIFLSPVLPELIKELNLENPPSIRTVGQTVMSTQTISFSASLPPKSAMLKMQSATDAAATEMCRVINQIISEKASKGARSLKLQSKGKNASLELSDEQAVSAAMDGLMQFLSPLKKKAKQLQDMNSLKQIGLAMHNFHDIYRHFPPQALSSQDGKKLLSWRVLILPFLDQNQLYRKFKLDEPWDSEHNIKLVSEIPYVYSGQQPSASIESDGMTRLQVPLLENSVFGRAGGGAQFKEITDGTSNTVMLLQVPTDQVVPWTKPVDFTIDPKNPTAGFVDSAQEHFLAGFCDGSVRTIRTSVAAKVLMALFTMNGNEVVDNDEL